MALALALLSLSLFSWGLGYKLSLYHTQSPQTRMAAAKLLSQKERVATVHFRSTTPPTGRNATLSGLSMISPAASLLPLGSSERVAGDEMETNRLFFSIQTSCRPPPFTAAS
jgi:hypothetical protein